MTTEEKTSELKQKLTQHIDEARAKLDALKKDLAAMHDEDVQALQQKRQEIGKRIDEQKERAKQMQADLVSWEKEKVAHTQEAIGSWRKRREVKKLESRAERAEQYARGLVVVAALDFEEAEQAILDAVAARFDANEASAQAAP